MEACTFGISQPRKNVEWARLYKQLVLRKILENAEKQEIKYDLNRSINLEYHVTMDTKGGKVAMNAKNAKRTLSIQ